VPGSNPYRLPRSVVPDRYDLRFEPDLDAATFQGSCSVVIQVVESVSEITLNAIELEIDEAWVEIGDSRLEATTISYDTEAERATLHLDGAVSGRATLHTRFRGVLNDKLHGFYRSTFTDTDGNDRTIATTQFEATDARRAFPCWDEPDLKAVFGITLVVPEGTIGVSNAGELSTEVLADGRRTITFADTMKMSTYLVAFIVGPLEMSQTVMVDGKALRVICPPGKTHLTGFALEVGAFALRYFAGYFDIVYPSDKLDLVAIPDFAFGAMENLGCVTFRETLLLVDTDAVTQTELQNVVDVIAHEIAHMWFGDLVTMKWWNGIWLNEAFATFMEMKCTDAFRPEWSRWTDFGLSRTGAFDTDSLESTRPIEYPVLSPDDAEGMFDVLTYEKGASVVWMLEQYLGVEAFRDGIRRYMVAHQFANTETTDLWDAIEAATGEPVRRIMDSWIFQGGYPVISVDARSGGTVLHFTQDRFRYESDGPDDSRWAVPLIVSHGSGGAAQMSKLLLDGNDLEIDLPEPVEWVKANAGATGFYRVHYAPDLLSALTARAQYELTPLERYALVDDTWASVLAGTTEVAAFLELAESFRDETEVAVWKRIIGGLSTLDRIVEGDAATALRQRVRALLRPVLDRMPPEPTDDENDRTRELRGVLFRALGTLADDDEVIARARKLLERDRKDGSVDPELSAAALVVVATHGDADDFAAIYDGFKAGTTPQEQQRHLFALAEVEDPELFDRVLELSMSGEVRTQNAPYLLCAAIHNRRNEARAWEFARRSWDAVNERFPSNSLVRMLEGVRTITSPELAADVSAFLVEHPLPQGLKTVAQHLERMQVGVRLRERDAARLADAL
jgi:puromycin-sensitive aminopeptidase